MLNKAALKYDFDSSKYAGCTIWSTGIEESIFEKKLFTKISPMKFEEYEFDAYEDYDAILRIVYGDYMKLPPEEERIGHHLYSTYLKEESNFE